MYYKNLGVKNSMECVGSEFIPFGEERDIWESVGDEFRALYMFLIERGDKLNPSDIDQELNYDFYGGNYYKYNDEEYVVIHNDHIESIFHDYAENLIDEVVLCDLPEKYQAYFDYDKFIHDMSFDGYGQMASYDGEDNEQIYNGDYYHILRMN